MKTTVNVKRYSPLEESINIASHATGLLASLVALTLLAIKSVEFGEITVIISFIVFGMSLTVLYAASTIYHSAKDDTLRMRLRVVDHAAIYVLIAGTYTPFTLITLSGKVGWILFAVSWSMATVGIVLKLFFTGRFTLLSTLMYVFMGWLIVFAIEPLLDNLSSQGLYWLVAGGIAYTVGAVLYAIKAIRFNHAIFHLFVLAGSCCHFISVYFYLLPQP